MRRERLELLRQYVINISIIFPSESLSLILVDSINGPDYILEESKKLAIPKTNYTDEADFTS